MLIAFLIAFTVLIVWSPCFFLWRKKNDIGHSMRMFWYVVLISSSSLFLFTIYASFELLRNVRKYMRSYYMEFRVKMWIQSLGMTQYIYF